ncbi:MAG TPA: prenyltransferase/squalene oxidase repeat-containing protein [Humisphaera sp.]
MTRPTPAARPARRRSFLVAAALLAGSAGGLVPVLPASQCLAAPAAAPEDEVIPPEVEQSVDKALAWLATKQGKDGAKPGSWDTGRASTTAVTALTLKAFMARGHVPGQGKYGDVINGAIDYLLEVQRDDGLVAGRDGNAVMYEHGIATAALGECYGMVDDARKARIEKALAKAVKLTLDAQAVSKGQGHEGGWRYTRTAADSDISVTGWQLMAMRSAANCGAHVPKEALEKGREYVRRCHRPDGSEAAGFSYQAGHGPPNAARTGTAIVSLEMLGDHLSKEAVGGGKYLLANPVTSPNEAHYYYTIYYVSQALYHLGGEYWQEGYVKKLRPTILANQGPEGTWPVGQGQEQEAGEAYRTSMAVLALCVPYRYLPLFQK